MNNRQTKVNDDGYVVIQARMIKDLKLKGNELLIYAIIKGFSQDGDSTFKGSLQYLADWTNSTRQGVLKNLQSLVDKKYVVKKEIIKNKVKYCEYYANEGVKQSLTGVLNIVEQGVKQSLHNNIEDNINENNSSNIYDFIEENFGRTLSPIEYEQISDWIDTELTRYAIKQAVLNGKYNIKYINTILNSYKNKSITSVQQAQEDELRFKQNKALKGNTKKPIRPSWMDQEIKREDDEIEITDEMRREVGII